MFVTREIRFLCWIAHVVRAWDLGSGPVAFMG
jgi:hypothetical protein